MMMDWQAAIAQLNDPNIDPKAAEQALLSFRSTDQAWSSVLQCLEQAAQPDVLLFAAQTLRHKVNESGASLPPQQLDQLKNVLLVHMQQPNIPAPLLRQYCLTLASVAALLPGWTGLVDAARIQLPLWNALELLHLVAEQGSSDWRDVSIPGFTAGKHLEWATSTRERFRSWSSSALPLLHTWLQQAANNTRDVVKLLACLGAWVRLGCLHVVPAPLAEGTLHAALLSIQSKHEQEVTAGLELLLELPEYAPEALVNSSRSSMLDMAQAACRAAAAASLFHAAAWVQAFAAYSASVPQQLLSPRSDPQGLSLRDALLQLSILPQVHDSQLLCLPALEVWGAEQVTAGLPCSGSQRALLADGSDGDTPGDTHQLPAAFGRTCQLLLLHTAANHLVWSQSAEGQAALESDGTAQAIQDVLQMTCQVLGTHQYLTAITHIWQQQPQQLQQEQVLQQQQQQQQVLHGSGGSGGLATSLAAAWVMDAADLEVLPAWQQQQVAAALEGVAAAPPGCRLHVAVLMAAAAGAAAGGVAGDAAGAGGAADEEAAAAAELNSSVVAASLSASDAKCAGMVAQLLSAAAAVMQRQLPSAADGLTQQQQQQMMVNFCTAAKVWSLLLVQHLMACQPSPPGDIAGMSGLLQLLLSIAAACEAAAAAAAAAVRAVISAALSCNWNQLHLFAPLVIQAVQLPCYAGAAEQDLLASLSGCLAAPGAAAQQLQDLRIAAAQQLLQPATAYLEQILQELQHGKSWSQLQSAADITMCHQLARVRAVLEGRLLLQQHVKQQLLQHQQQQQETVGAAGTGSSGSGQDDADREADVLAEQLAVTAMDEDGNATVCSQEPSSTAAGSVSQARGAGQLQQCRRRVSVAASDPAIQLLLTQLWPQLHCCVIQHQASGRFLHHYGKCCSRLLRIHPSLLLPQLQQFLQVAVAGMTRPGGSSLAEPFGLLIDLCCRPGTEVLLDSGPHLMQAVVELWSRPEVVALQQPGAGDDKPDLAEQVLKLTTTFVKNGRLLAPHGASVAVTEQAVATATSCACCCHRKVASCALALLSAVLDATNGSDGPQQQLLLEMIGRRAVHVAQGVLGALLAPSPLPRLHKASTVLLELAAAVGQLARHSAAGAIDGGGSSASSSATPASLGHGAKSAEMGVPSLHELLTQAVNAFVPGCVSPAEAAQLSADCASLLAGGSGSQSRSYVVSRRLKRRLRDFAETHMRSSSSGQHK